MSDTDRGAARPAPTAPPEVETLIAIIAALRDEIATAANILDAWLDMTRPSGAASVVAAMERLTAALDIGRGLRAARGGSPGPQPPMSRNVDALVRLLADLGGVGNLRTCAEALAARGVAVLTEEEKAARRAKGEEWE